MRLAYAFSCSALLLTFGLACDSASPVAPTGTLLTISASPSEITANGTSTIRVTALRANGTPVNPGTIVRLDTTLGSVDAQVEVDETGVATATLRGDGRIGVATVTARSGSSEAAMVEVMVGRSAANVSLQATPSQVSEDGGTITLLAVVRDDDGEPLANATVNFTTEVGRLLSGGSILRTDSGGQITDQLVVEAVDLAPITANSFSVGVVVGAEGATRDASVMIRINRCLPVVEFRAENLGNNQARVFNDTTGLEPIDWEWDKENDGVVDSIIKEPAPFVYPGPGLKRILLRASNECGTDEDVVEVDVTSDPP
jgi:hypothetical protein